jgi:hypothetical protein
VRTRALELIPPLPDFGLLRYLAFARAHHPIEQCQKRCAAVESRELTVRPTHSDRRECVGRWRCSDAIGVPNVRNQPSLERLVLERGCVCAYRRTPLPFPSLCAKPSQANPAVPVSWAAVSVALVVLVLAVSLGALPVRLTVCVLRLAIASKAKRSLSTVPLPLPAAYSTVRSPGGSSPRAQDMAQWDHWRQAMRSAHVGTLNRFGSRMLSVYCGY